MQSLANAAVEFPQPQQAPPPSSEISVHRHPTSNVPIFCVLGPDDVERPFRFSKRLQKLTLCTDFVQESDLYPEYAIRSQRLQKMVLFANNQISRRMEQFVLDSGVLQQVTETDSGLKYDWKNVKNSGGILMTSEDGKIRIENSNGFVKMDNVYGIWNRMESQGVKMLEENSEDPDVTEFKIRYDENLQKDVLYILDSQGPLKLTFDAVKMEFLPSEDAPDFITEDHLYPKYSEFSPGLNRHVIHVWNSETEKYEQYCYSTTTRGFMQLENTGLRYNPERRKMEGTVLFVVAATSSGTNGSTVIMVDADGFLRKEEYCRIREEYLEIGVRPVKTLVEMKREKEMRRRANQKMSEVQKSESKDSKVQKEVSESQKTSEVQKSSSKNAEDPKAIQKTSKAQVTPVTVQKKSEVKESSNSSSEAPKTTQKSSEFQKSVTMIKTTSEVQKPTSKDLEVPRLIQKKFGVQNPTSKASEAPKTVQKTSEIQKAPTMIQKTSDVQKSENMDSKVPRLIQQTSKIQKTPEVEELSKDDSEVPRLDSTLLSLLAQAQQLQMQRQNTYLTTSQLSKTSEDTQKAHEIPDVFKKLQISQKTAPACSVLKKLAQKTSGAVEGGSCDFLEMLDAARRRYDREMKQKTPEGVQKNLNLQKTSSSTSEDAMRYRPREMKPTVIRRLEEAPDTSTSSEVPMSSHPSTSSGVYQSDWEIIA